MKVMLSARFDGNRQEKSGGAARILLGLQEIHSNFQKVVAWAECTITDVALERPVPRSCYRAWPQTVICW